MLSSANNSMYWAKGSGKHLRLLFYKYLKKMLSKSPHILKLAYNIKSA